MKGLRAQLVSLGNSTDPTGNYIFSGSRVKSPAFKTNTDGSVSYQGDQTKMSIQVGDQRTISVNRPATTAFVPVVRNGVGVSFFDSIDSLIAGVKAGDSSVMQRGLTEMDTLHNGIVLAQAQAGTDMKVVEQQGAAIEDTKLSLMSALSKIEDLDMATAITDMQKLMLSLEAAQSSFAKTSQLSLFKYLG
jgi:flagellar hook-associated protein 3 FlgL